MIQNSTLCGLAAPPAGGANAGVIPAKAGIHVSPKTPVFHLHTMGPRLRGDDASYQPQAQPYFKSRNAGHLLPPG